MTKIYSSLALIFLLTLVACGGADDKKQVYFEKAEQRYEEGDYEKARIELQNVLQIDPNYTPARFLLGQVMEQLQEYRAAVSQYNAVIEQDETNVKARVRLGQFYLLAKQTESAMEIVNKALEYGPDDSDALTLRGSVFMRLGQDESALLDVEKALNADPKNINAILLKSTLLVRMGKQEEGISLLQTKLKQFPENSLLRNALASVYLGNDDSKAAIEQIRLLIADQPNELFNYLRLADLYFATGDKVLTEKTLREANQQFSDNDEAKFALVRFINVESGRDAAINELTQFIADNPDNYRLRLALAALYQSSGESDKTVAIYKEIIEQDELGPQGLNARISLAAIYANTGKIPEARSLLTEVLTETPNNQTALALRGRINLYEQDPVSAIADFRSAMRNQPESVPLLKNLAQAHLENDELDLAMDFIKRAIKINEQDLSLRQEYIQMLAQKGDEEQVIQQLDEVLSIDPDNLVAMQALFRVHALRKDWNALSIITSQIKEAYPDNAIGYYLAGLTLQAQGQIAESTLEFNQAVELAPNALEPLNELVKNYLASNAADKALTRLNQLLELEPDSIYPRNLIGEVYINQNRIAAAIPEFEKIITLKPDWPVAYRNLAGSYLLMKDTEKAIEVLEAGIGNTEFSPLLVTQLARIYEGKGELDKAISLYEQVLLNDAQNSIAVNNLAMLLIDYRDDEKSLMQAEALMSSLKDTENPAYLDTIGWLKYKQGKYSDAVSFLERAVNAAPDNAGLNYHLGMAYFKLGQQDNAKKALAIATQTENRYLGFDEALKALESL